MNKSVTTGYYRNRNKEIRALIQAAKDVPCTDCKKYFGLHATGLDQMTLDHLPGYPKRMSFADCSRFAISAVVEELKKAEPVCVRCHQLRTKQRDASPEGQLRIQLAKQRFQEGRIIRKVFNILKAASGFWTLDPPKIPTRKNRRRRNTRLNLRNQSVNNSPRP